MGGNYWAFNVSGGQVRVQTLGDFVPLGLHFCKVLKGFNMTNLFDQFQGADLDRFADCLTAIRKAGLKTDKHTQAGVNQNSGNVWVWCEDWQGAVACSIGFDVFWVYSCRECGEEFEFDSYAELEEFSEDNAEDCTMCRTDDSETYDEFGVNTKNSFNTEVTA